MYRDNIRLTAYVLEEVRVKESWMKQMETLDLMSQTDLYLLILGVHLIVNILRILHYNRTYMAFLYCRIFLPEEVMI